MAAVRTSGMARAGASSASRASGSSAVPSPGSAPSPRTRSASGGDSIGSLQAVQGGIPTVGRHELGMGATLANAAGVQIENEVGPTRELQVVGDQKRGAPFGHPPQSLDHGAFVFAVQPCGGFVENE